MPRLDQSSSGSRRKSLHLSEPCFRMRKVEAVTVFCRSLSQHVSEVMIEAEVASSSNPFTFDVGDLDVLVPSAGVCWLPPSVALCPREILDQGSHVAEKGRGSCPWECFPSAYIARV